jgi:hypothetical protein
MLQVDYDGLTLILNDDRIDYDELITYIPSELSFTDKAINYLSNSLLVKIKDDRWVHITPSK